MKQISKEALAQLREVYKPGTLVELVRMGDDPYPGKLKPGCRGKVSGVDDIGTIFVDWFCGSSLGVAYGEDFCKVVKDDEKTID